MSRTNKKPKTREHLLSPIQIKTVLSTIKKPEEELIFKSLIFTGLRISEFIHLNRDWINFNRNLIRIPEKQRCDCMSCLYIRRKLKKRQDVFEKQEASEEVDADFRSSRRRRKKKKGLSDRQKLRIKGYWTPKTVASERTIPIVEEAQEVLYPYFKKHDSILEIFPARQYVNNILKRLEKRSKVKLFPHCLRGTFATMLAIKGFNPYEITDTMGWSDINIAIFYIKMSGAGLKNAFEEKWARVYD